MSHSTATSYSVHFEGDDSPTLVTPIGRPCRFAGGCTSIELNFSGRCTAHQASRPVLAETPDQRTRRLALELAAIGAAYVERCTSVPAGAWS